MKQHDFALPKTCPKCGAEGSFFTAHYQQGSSTLVDIEGYQAFDWLAFPCHTCHYEVRRLCLDMKIHAEQVFP